MTYPARKFSADAALRLRVTGRNAHSDKISSALPQIAEMSSRCWHLRFGPLSDERRNARTSLCGSIFLHLILVTDLRSLSRCVTQEDELQSSSMLSTTARSNEPSG